MSSGRLRHGTAILPTVSLMDEVQLAQHVRSNVPGPIGNNAASFIRVLKISGRIFMEMQYDDLEIISQGDRNVMQIYLKLQGKVVIGRVRERRRSLAEVYPEIGPRFPSLRDLSNESNRLRESSNKPSLSDESTQQHSASDQGAPGTSPASEPIEHMLALDNTPAVNFMVQTRHHHTESTSGNVTGGMSVELRTWSKDVVVEGEIVAASGLTSHEIASPSTLTQGDELFTLGHTSSRTPIRPTQPVASSQQQSITKDLNTGSIVTLANISGPTAQAGPHRLEFDDHTSPEMAVDPLTNDKSKATEAIPFIQVVSLGIIPTIQEGGEAAPHGSIAGPQNTESTAPSMDELCGYTGKSTPQPKEDIPSVTSDLQATPTARNEPPDQDNSVHVDERSIIVSDAFLDETPSVDEAACLEMNGFSAARSTHICDPISEAASNLSLFDPRTEDPCPLDLSADIVTDDNDTKMSQNILHTPRAAFVDPFGGFIPASLPLDAGGISIGSPKRSNSTSSTPGAVSNVFPIASTSPGKFQDQVHPSLSSDPPQNQISRNKNAILKAGPEVTFRTLTPHIFDSPTSSNPHVGPSPFCANDGGVEAHSHTLATFIAPSRVASLDLDDKTAAQGNHGISSEPTSNVNAADNNASDSVNDASCFSFFLGLPDSSETALPLKIEITPADHLPDYTSCGSDIDYMGVGLSLDGLRMDITSINATDGRALTKGFPGMASKEDPGSLAFTSDDSNYDTASECCYAVDISPPTNLSADRPVLECSGRGDAAHGPGGPLLCLLPITSRLPSLEYWYSPTDTSESFHLWSTIFDQVHTSCREACAEPTTEIKSRHMFPTIPSLSGQDELYVTTTLPLCSDADTGKSHESGPAANNPIVPAHSTLLPQLDFPILSLTEEISAISPLLCHSVFPSEAYEPSLPSSPVGSKMYFRKGACSQRSLFPIIGGHHDSGLHTRSPQSERTHAKEEPSPPMPPTPPSPVCQVTSDLLRTGPKDSPMDQERQHFRTPLSAARSPPKLSFWEGLLKLLSLTTRT